MNKSESIAELAKALVKAQAEIGGAKKTSDNPFHKTKYADLESVREAIKGPLVNNGLSYIQGFETTQTGVLICTLLMHTSGEWVESQLLMPLAKVDPQGMGSAITYGRRYSLMAIVGIAPEDDDGEAAMGRQTQQPKQQPKPQQQTAQGQQTTQQGQLTQKQLSRLWAIAQEHKMSADQLKALIKKEFGIESSADLTKPQYDRLCDELIPAAAKQPAPTT